jgi:release factor glutamine methyltransferase
MTLSDLAAEAAHRLRQAGLDEADARRDASLLARHAAAWDAARWLTDARSTIASPEFSASFSRLVARRARREPLAYITGTREFYGRLFGVEPAVLIPRQETEMVVDAVLDLTRNGTAVRVLDIGTGSGCLAITIAAERAAAQVTATDASEAALTVARQNAARIGVKQRIEWRLGDLIAGATGPFDVIMTNPPYVPEGDRASLDPEVVEYEPAAALFAGEDGLEVIRRLVPAAATLLRPGGSLIIEIGAGQSRAVEAILGQSKGLRLMRFVHDLQSIPRVAIAAVERGATGL